jgi:superfamily II DNA/RNA helicase
MYNSRRRSHSFSNRGRNNRFQHAQGRGRTGEKIDINLFIKRAVSSVVLETASQAANITFSDFKISDRLKRNISDHGYTVPTSIQNDTIPLALNGSDVIGIANTGTGKTAAFLIPLIEKSDADRSQRVIILTPTRELAMQIADEMRAFSRGTGLESALCIGGANIIRQEKKLHHNPHFIVGTPGRIKDLIRRGRLNLNIYNNVVLDEADRMVDMGFINEIKYFISLLPKKRQSLFFSATIPEKVKAVLNSFVTNPVTVSVKKQDTSENVDQDIVRFNKGNKLDILHDHLTREGFNKVLIFGQTKWGVQKLTDALIVRGIKAAAIHGNKSQGQRQRALEQFKNNEIKVLLATDVASRGLDINNVTHVINYDIPATYQDYIHRIGRTGRGDKHGVALTFVE